MVDFNKLANAVKGKAESVVNLLRSGSRLVYCGTSADKETGESALEAAVKEGDVEMVKLLLDFKVYFCAETILKPAIESENEEIVRLLLEHGAKLNKTTELHRAIELGNESLVKLFLEFGADANSRERYEFNEDTKEKVLVRSNLLLTAISRGNEKIVELLLNHGADTFVIDRSGNNPLLVAAKGGNEKIFKIFLDRDINPKDRNYRGENAMHAAGEGHNENIVKLLVNRGLDISGVNRIGDTILNIAAMSGGDELFLQSLLNLGSDVKRKNDKGDTVLHSAARGGNIKAIEFFLNVGIGIDEVNSDNMTALHLACLRGFTGAMKILIDRGASIDRKAPLNTSNYRRMLFQINTSALGFAIASINVDSLVDSNSSSRASIKLLLDRGMKFNDTDNELDGSPLLVAVTHFQGLYYNHDSYAEGTMKNATGIIEELLVYGLDVDVKGCHGETAVRTAVVCRMMHCSLQLLLDHQVDIEARERYDDCILFMARRVCENLNIKENMPTEILMRHMVKLKSLGLHVSEDNLKEMQEIDNKSELQSNCEKEIKRLKDQTFKDSSVTYYVFWMTQDLNQLAAYTRNENIVGALTLRNLKSSYPNYATSLYNQLRKGLWRRRMMDRVAVFFQAFTEEEANKNIPKLPQRCVHEILRYLSNRDLRVLIGICNPRRGFDVEIDSLL